MKGCECGNKLFIYIRPITEREASELKEKGDAKEVATEGKNIWNIQVKEGVYEIDIKSLMMEEPVIVAGDEGRYLLSLSSVFRDKKKESKLIKKLRRK